MEEGVKPGKGSPAARAEMREMLAEFGYNPEDYASDEDDSDDDEVAAAPKQAEAARQQQQQSPDQARRGTPAGPSKQVQRRCLCSLLSSVACVHHSYHM